MTKYLLISIRSEWVYHILNHNKSLELRRVIPQWVIDSVRDGVTVKCLIYCTKALPYLAFDFNDYPESHCGYELYETKLALDFRNLDDSPLNGKIIGEFDLNKIDKLSYPLPWPITDRKEYPDFLSKSMVSPTEFLSYKPKYGLWIENLNVFICPKELSNYYAPNSEVLRRAPQNMMTVFEEN